ncbi:MAG: hypothetical protein A2W26_06295 [Acidobacteria bacterium RBG_16_64_8]|nr:MAG: hypothetical protein A2W26_06295 [Acidobacteria bacterium RBG_16_64_8]
MCRQVVRVLATPPPELAGIAAVTLDLHEGDDPVDIRLALASLAERRVRATVFVPTAMLEESRYRAAVREIASNGHEPASHSHRHDFNEIQALISGRPDDLAFLAQSQVMHEDFFGASPTAFRSPCWCHLGRAAIDALTELGYVADSSATPQRLGVFSSTPFENVWTFSLRRLYYLSPTLLEVPTSTLLVPGGSPSFTILRRQASRILVATLASEVRMFPARVLALQFHANAFNPASTRYHRSRKPLTLRSFLPSRFGGFEFKHHLRSDDSAALAALTGSILNSLERFACLTMTQIVTGSWRSAPSLQGTVPAPSARGTWSDHRWAPRSSARRSFRTRDARRSDSRSSMSLSLERITRNVYRSSAASRSICRS